MINWLSNACNLYLIAGFIGLSTFLFLLFVVIRSKKVDPIQTCSLFLLVAMTIVAFYVALNPELRMYEREALARKNKPFEETSEFRRTGIWLIVQYGETVKNPLPEPYVIVPPKAIERRAEEIKELYNHLIKKKHSILWPLPEYHDPASLPLDKYYWIPLKDEKQIYPEGEALDPEWFQKWLRTDAIWCEDAIQDPKEAYEKWQEIEKHLRKF